MKFRSRKIKIELLALIIAFVAVIVSPFYSYESVKASGGFTFPYYFTDYQYRQIIESMGLSQDQDYNSDSITPVFCNFSSFTDWNDNADYTSYVQSFGEFLESDSHFQSFENLGNMVIRFDGNQANGVFKVYMMSSERPLYLCGKNYYSFVSGASTDFDTNYLELRYAYYQGSFSFVSVESTSNNYLGGGNDIDGTLFKMSFGSDFERGIVYSDAVVRCKYRSENSSLDCSDGSLSMNYNLHFAAELDNYTNYSVCQLDRRTLFPEFNDSQISDEDRIILENSRCGLKRQAYYINGTPDSLLAHYQYELNEYTKLRKNSCAVQVSFDYQCGGNYEEVSRLIGNKIEEYYMNHSRSVTLIEGSPSNFTAHSFVGDTTIDFPLDDSLSVDEIDTVINNYLAGKSLSGLYCLENRVEQIPCDADAFIRAMGSLTGYTINYGMNNGLTIGNDFIKYNPQIAGTHTARLSFFKVVITVQIVDYDNPDKNSLKQRFGYDLVSGSVTDYGEPIIYDDTDIVDYHDDPTYEIPTVATTETSTGSTTQTVVNPGNGGTVTVSNSNVNNNNPEIHVTPSINVNVGTGTGSDSDSDDDGFVVIKDDDSVEYEDVQGVMDGVENFLDFGDTFYDEYMAEIFDVLPEGVWRPFMICSAFISLAAMIGYILRR